MRGRIVCLVTLFAAWIVPSSAPAQSWVAVGTGIEYRQFTLPNPDPNNVFVARLDRANLQATIESSIAQGQLASGRETVRGMAGRYDQALSYWGQAWGGRNHVVIAVNGDFFNITTGLPEGGQIQSGWYAKRFNDWGGRSGFVWPISRAAFIGECVSHTASRQFITFMASGATQPFQDINQARGSDQLVIYTPQYDATTLTDDSGVEVVVEMSRPSLILPQPAKALGYVREIRDGQGSTYIPFDHVVLSATGSQRTTLLGHVHVGDQIGISQEVTHWDTEHCATQLALSWTKAFAAIGGNFVYLKDGVVQPTDDLGLTTRNPRTAICLNDAYVYFIVVDGRDPGVSVGMTIGELGTFSRDTLAATQCVNQDGGGSSTMVVNGSVMNNPSDGTERTVANGMMMVVVEPKQQSTALAPGDPVTTKAATDVRLGPGTNYEMRGSVAKNAAGTVLAHLNGLNGVLAKGWYWWKVDFGSLSGWVPRESLTGPRGAVAGTVTDAATGLPLAGVTLKAWDDSAQLLASAITGANGAYLLEGVLPGTRFVTTADTVAYRDELYPDLPCDPSCSVVTGTGVSVAAETTTPGTDFALMRIADLSITKTDGQTTAVTGQPVTYTIVVSNAGPSAANGMTVTDTVPPALTGVTWTCVGAGGGSCSPSGSGSIGDTVSLPVGGTVTYTLTGTVSASATGSLGNTATVTAPGGVTDPNPTDNSATDTDAVVPVADLSITKTDGRDAAAQGWPVTYTVVVSNAGPAAASGARVTDAVPPEITGVTWACLGASGATCTASGTGSIDDTVNLPVGGTLTYTLTGTVSASARGSLENTATVSPPGGVIDPDPSNDSATDTDTLSGLGLFTLAPCRVVDTRGGAPIGGPVLHGQETRVFALAGHCGIPTTAAALSINVTVTQPSAPGSLRLFPAGETMPLASSLNYAAGQTRTNNAVIALSDGGELAAFVVQPVGTTVHLIIDVNGYFE